jgi:hypothetical protein
LARSFACFGSSPAASSAARIGLGEADQLDPPVGARLRAPRGTGTGSIIPGIGIKVGVGSSWLKRPM